MQSNEAGRGFPVPARGRGADARGDGAAARSGGAALRSDDSSVRVPALPLPLPVRYKYASHHNVLCTPNQKNYSKHHVVRLRKAQHVLRRLLFLSPNSKFLDCARYHGLPPSARASPPTEPVAIAKRLQLEHCARF